MDMSKGMEQLPQNPEASQDKEGIRQLRLELLRKWDELAKKETDALVVPGGDAEVIASIHSNIKDIVLELWALELRIISSSAKKRDSGH